MDVTGAPLTSMGSTSMKQVEQLCLPGQVHVFQPFNPDRVMFRHESRGASSQGCLDCKNRRRALRKIRPVLFHCVTVFYVY